MFRRQKRPSPSARAAAYEAFPAAPDLLGANEQASNGAVPQRVVVNGKRETLWKRSDLPRYILGWSQDGRDLAISADSTSLTGEQVVSLANSVTVPR